MIGGRSALLGAASGLGYGNWAGNYSDVSLLLRNGTPVLVPSDESPTPKAITAVGNAGISTTTFKYGGSALAFDGNGDYLSSPISSAFEFGTGDFTVEAWVRFNALPSSYWQRIAGVGRGANGISPVTYTGWSFFYADGFLWFYRYDGQEPIINRSWTPTVNTWHHVAASRIGTSLRLFVDGNMLGAAATSSTSFNKVNDEDLFIGYGSRATVDNFLNGFIDDLRITKGIARYVEGTGANAGKMVFAGTNNLALPAAELPANITDDPSYNSVSLLLRGNRVPGPLVLADESPTPKTITAVGNAGISTTTFKYGTSALSFDGSDDYFEITDTNNDFDLGGSNATLELWVYPMTASGLDCIIGKSGNTASWNTSDGFEYQLQYDKSINCFVFNFNNGSGPGGASSLSGGTQATGSWYHLAVVTNASNNITLYINGINVASATSSIAKPASRTRFRLGTDLSGNYFTGYVDDLRVTRNFARYTKNFLPPPAQLPAI